ncbi:MAG TPA: phytanoyl-CoA dioxygenase family protein [Armatimonadota bacterium]|nr:phytanoyl-CoA dioxygenase family protein [Armatimonadota bacterium]
MPLSDAQVRFFRTFGYQILREAFTPEEVAWITEEFEFAIHTYGGGRDHDGTKRTMFGAPSEHTPKLCSLVDHPSVHALAAAALGEDFNYAGGDGNYYSGDTGWHPDGNWGQLFACKIAFYLDPLTSKTGCLRVIPGSHRPDHFIRAEKIDPNQSLEMFGVPPSEFPGNVALETNPGDLLIFNHDTYHAAFGGGPRRRMFTMNLTRRCSSHEDLTTLRRYLSVHSAGGYNVDTGAGMYMPMLLDTAGDSRMTHLQQCAAIHDELFPQFARKR